MAYGDVGYAQILGHPQYDMGALSGRKGSSAASSVAGRDPLFDQELDELLGDAPSDFQLDAAGLDDQYLKSYMGLRSLAKELLAKGIDVTGAPDPTHPQSRQAIQQFNRAMAQHFHNRERLKQGKSLQERAMTQRDAGNIYAQPDMGQGLMTTERYLQDSFVTTNKLVNAHNSIMQTRNPKTQAEKDELVAFHAQQVAELDDLAETGVLSREAADHYKAQLAPPPGFDSESRDLDLEVKRANIRAKNAAASASRAKAKEAELPKANALPALRALAEWAQASDQPGIGESYAPQAFSGQYFAGSGLNGEQENGVYQGITPIGNGQYEITFSKTEEIPIPDEDGNIVPGGQTRKRTTLTEIAFGKDDILPALAATMKPGDFAKVSNELKKQGVMVQEKVPLERVLQYSNIDPGTVQQRPKSAKKDNSLEGFKEQIKQVAKAKGVTVDYPEEKWEELHKKWMKNKN